ncbi:DUF1669 domain-containing protein [Desulfofundulus thermobenzoicus]|uniref:phospholipase D n=2 Tax=Desulfofundulus thermobenzoicus TaxID=29376 RepID=A0A6N7IT79_9FIRM|nr:DUF1669 domain-containing protein [Desulfofundulus thermobenzoicus]
MHRIHILPATEQENLIRKGFASMRVRMFILALALLLLSGCASSYKTTDQQSAPSVNQAAAVPPNQGGAGPLGTPVFTRTNTDPAETLTKLFTGAQKEIDIACYSFTHPEIIKSVLAAKKRGIQIRVITDREQTRGETQQQAMNELVKAGIPVKVNVHPGLMNLRMSIVDGDLVATGTYNYNPLTAKNNDEMLVTLKDESFAAACEKEFERMWSDSREFTSLKGNTTPAKTEKVGTTSETGKAEKTDATLEQGKIHPTTHSSSKEQHKPVAHG